jgi:hypothetical protein
VVLLRKPRMQVGLQEAVVGFNNSVVGSIHQDRHEIRLVLNDLGKAAQEAALREFIDAILDLAGETRT